MSQLSCPTLVSPNVPAVLPYLGFSQCPSCLALPWFLPMSQLSCPTLVSPNVPALLPYLGFSQCPSSRALP
ncbi:hypothetical protein DPMN_099604 [Dreissena polymorpha]|uniref:Uncharacterized protein n=1 Tax=Dreissena polymorpha TaxID=45954 RepID=A0A9D4LGP7_DREPO|nr:hypothetical protein DPMN_099604 [Dreissena polymorpha]